MALKAVKKMSWRAVIRTPAGSSTTINKPKGMTIKEFERRAHVSMSAYRRLYGIDTTTKAAKGGGSITIRVKSRSMAAPDLLVHKVNKDDAKLRNQFRDRVKAQVLLIHLPD